MIKLKMFKGSAKTTKACTDPKKIATKAMENAIGKVNKFVVADGGVGVLSLYPTITDYDRDEDTGVEYFEAHFTLLYQTEDTTNE